MPGGSSRRDSHFITANNEDTNDLPQPGRINVDRGAARTTEHDYLCQLLENPDYELIITGGTDEPFGPRGGMVSR